MGSVANLLYHLCWKIQSQVRGALRIWDKLPEGFGWPAQQLSAQDAGDGYLADVIASQPQGHLPWMSISRPFTGRLSLAKGVKR
jgi:hypothetical protein